MKKIIALSLAAFCAVQLGGTVSAVTLFGPGDPTVAIDTDDVVSSSYPGAEGPGNAVDQAAATKYLNFGAAGTGFIFTPSAASTIQSLQLTAANDAPERDPFSYDLFGFNGAVTSGDNSLGDQEAWSLISSGSTGMDTDPGRGLPGTVIDFTNSTAYDNYKIVFPTLRDAGAANSMQVAEVSLFTGMTGGGSVIALDPFGGGTVLAVSDFSGSQSSIPGDGENSAKAIDGDLGSKYLNFANANSGFIVSRADGLKTVVESLTFTTGNDAPGRDPLVYELFGTDDPVSSAEHSLGDAESWTLVDSGSTGLEDLFDMGDMNEHRVETGSAQAVANATAYGAYRIVFPVLRGSPDEGIMQVGEVRFDGTVVPEPSTLVLALLGLAACGRRRK